MHKTWALLLTVNDDRYRSTATEVKINNFLVGYRPYDGSSVEEIANEVAGCIAGVLNIHLGWPLEDPSDLDDD